MSWVVLRDSLTHSKRFSLERLVVFRDGQCLRGLELGVVLSDHGRIDGNLSRSQSRGSYQLQIDFTSEFASQPEERTLKVVVTLGRDVIVGEVLLAVEGDLLGLDLASLDVNLVTAQNDRDVVANANQITMPVGDTLVTRTRGHIEHDDCTLALDVVAVTQTTELLLTSSVPAVEGDLTPVGVKRKRMHFDTQCGNVLFLELTSKMTLHKGGLSDTTITNQNQLKLGSVSHCQ
mmetsp:Transcript_2567/g.8060  ORF Transcript_2567/g.8060 Transcript_2567/m.8060 type:complete len:233 (-) Transcript_2567:67-765(-)